MEQVANDSWHLVVPTELDRNKADTSVTFQGESYSERFKTPVVTIMLEHPFNGLISCI